MNDFRFYKIEIDTEQIETFVREGFEEKLGNGYVLGMRLARYPNNEFFLFVSVRKKTTQTSEIANELRKTLSNSGLSVVIIVQENELAFQSPINSSANPPISTTQTAGKD
jgi:hypothetical protein